MQFLMLSLLSLALPIDKGLDDTKDVENELNKIVQLGPGVHAVTKDAKGRIVSCVVVGQSRISTALGKTKGVQVARDRARLDASAQFVKWLKESTSVYQKSEDETILFIEGDEKNDKQAIKESGKSVEKTTSKIETVAQGLARGFQLLHTEVNDKDKTFTLVLGWDRETANSTKGVEKVNSDEKNANGGSKQRNGAADSEKNVEKLESKKATSSDAKKFFPGKKQ